MRLPSLLLTLLFALHLSAQDVRCAYSLSRLSSYIALDSITPATPRELADTLSAIAERHHSPDFVIDLLHCRGTFGQAAEEVGRLLRSQCQRVAFLVGTDTGQAGEQLAVDLRHSRQAIILGDVEGTRLTADVELSAYRDYQNAWYDSLHTAGVIAEAAGRYADANPQRMARYADAHAMYLNFDENAPFVDMLHLVAAEHGIQRDDEAFYYSGYMLLAEARAEMIRHCFPHDSEAYHRALNIQIDTAISIARDNLETPAYRQLLGLTE